MSVWYFPRAAAERTLSEAGIVWTKRCPMKGSFWRAVSRRKKYRDGRFSYLEDVLLYPWNTGGIVDNGKEADSAKVAGL